MKLWYSDDYVTLWQGDCCEVTGWLAADVLVTDPPYGMALRSGWNGAHGDLRIEGDDSPAVRDAALSAWGDRPALVFGRWSVPRPAGTRMVLTWDKGEHVGMGDLSLPWKPNTEEVYVLGSGFTGHRGGSVLSYLAVAGTVAVNRGRSHPTEKPTDLMGALIDKCPPEWVIADPFAGSGSTLVAAKARHRKAIGVELDPCYCDVIAARLAQDVLPLGGAA